MKLRRVRNPPPKLAGRVPGELHEAVTAYARYYREEHRDAIDLWPLVVPMLRVFVDDDRLRQAWRREYDGRAATPRRAMRIRTLHGVAVLRGSRASAVARLSPVSMRSAGLTRGAGPAPRASTS